MTALGAAVHPTPLGAADGQGWALLYLSPAQVWPWGQGTGLSQVCPEAAAAGHLPQPGQGLPSCDEQELIQKYLLVMHSPVSWKGLAEGGIPRTLRCPESPPERGLGARQGRAQQAQGGMLGSGGLRWGAREPNERTLRRERSARDGGKRQKGVGDIQPGTAEPGRSRGSCCSG